MGRRLDDSDQRFDLADPIFLDTLSNLSGCTMHMNQNSQTAMCINIGWRERCKRFVLGVGMCALGIGLAVVLINVDAPRWWRLALFIPFWVGMLGLVQAFKSTCVVLAGSGVRHLDGGEEPIQDEILREQLRKRARGIYMTSTSIAVLLTLLSFVG